MWAKSSKVCDYRTGNITAPPGKLYATSPQDEDTRRLVDAAPVPSNNNLQRKKRENTSRKGDQSDKSSSARPTKGSDGTTYCESVRLKGTCHAAGGPHWRVQEASHYGNSQQRGRKWHPPIGMHLLRAEMLVYTYAQIVLDAIYMVEDALHKAQEAAKVEAKPVKKGWGRQKKSSKAPEGYPLAALALLTGWHSSNLVAANLNPHKCFLNRGARSIGCAASPHPRRAVALHSGRMHCSAAVLH